MGIKVLHIKQTNTCMKYYDMYYNKPHLICMYAQCMELALYNVFLCMPIYIYIYYECLYTLIKDVHLI